MHLDNRERRLRAQALARGGRIGELRGLADTGDRSAAWELASWLTRTGHLDELRERMAAGDVSARWAYSNHLVRLRRIPEAIDTLRPVADSGIAHAQRRLARLLAGYGRQAEAMAVLARAPAHFRDTSRVERWLRSRGLAGGSTGSLDVRAEYLDSLRRGTVADARVQLCWIVLLWWRSRFEAAVALLDDIGPCEWLHERLAADSSGGWSHGFRDRAIDLLGTAGNGGYRRTRAALLLSDGRRDDAVAELRALAAEGDQHAAGDLARVLDAPMPLREIRLADHPDRVYVNGIQFSPDGATLAAWGHGVGVRARVVLWDVLTGRPGHTQIPQSPYPGGMDFRPDGTVEERPGRSPWEYPSRLSAPDGSVVAVCTRGRVRLCDATGSPVRDLAVDAGAMAFHPDGTVLAIAARHGVQLWEVATGRLVRTVETPAHAMAFRQDGGMLATVDRFDDVIRLWPLGPQR